jgi:uncharacterized repeat protein (TIGR01451 family)
MSKTRLFMLFGVILLSLAMVGLGLAADNIPDDITGSTVNYIDPDSFSAAGETVDLCFNMTMTTTTDEYLDGFDFDLPDDWTVNFVYDQPQNSNCGYGHAYGVDAGNLVYWYTNGMPFTQCGEWFPGSYDFCANVTIPAGCTGGWEFPWMIWGDGYGGVPPSTVEGSIAAECGGAAACTPFTEVFETWPPAGWEIVNYGGDCVWESTATTARSNYTGGTGSAADADSDWCGSSTTMNTGLLTPVFSLEGTTAPTFSYRYDFNALSGSPDTGTVDITLDGGSTWTNLVTYLDDNLGPAQNILDLSAYAGQPNVQLRFGYWEATYDWWFEVDDAALSCGAQDVPDIEVTPLFLSAEQPTNTQTTQNLQICNVGDADLTWEIEEDPAVESVSVLPSREAPKVAVPETVTRSTNNPQAPVPAANPDAVLWEQMTDYMQGGVSEDFPSEGWGAFSADDFQNAQTWSIENIYIPGWNAGVSMYDSTFHWCFYEDAGGVPAGHPYEGGEFLCFSELATDPSVTIGGTYGGDVTVDVVASQGAPVVLPPGTWWLVFYPEFPDSFNYWWYWFFATSTNMSNAQLVDPMNYFGMGATSWTPWTNLGVTYWDLAFRLEGTPGGVIDIPWLSEDPVTGTIPAGSCQDVTVTFDSTGLAPDTYFGELDVVSNDPDEPEVVVPVDLTVTGGSACTPFSEPFESWPPAGWEVINYGGDCVWESTATTLRANFTGGTGFAADADSDWCGSGFTMDTALVSPEFNLVGAPAPTFSYSYDYQSYSGIESGTVDISTDGGTTWTNLVTYVADDSGPAQNILNLSAYVGQPSVMMRFGYWNAAYDWWFEVDDATLSCDNVQPPDIDVTPASMSSVLPPDSLEDQTLTIANLGGSDLVWNLFEENLPGSFATPVANKTLANTDVAPVSRHPISPLALGDLLFEVDVEAATGSILVLGVEFALDHYWVTYGDAAGGTGWLAKIDTSGALVSTYSQAAACTGWGGRDLAFDGTYLYYGCDNGLIYQVDPATGAPTGTTISAPLAPPRALAFDPATGHFWTANWDSSLYEIDMSGTVINSFPPIGLSTYGMAWDVFSPGGPFLWTWSQDGGDPALLATQINPATGVPTGVSFLGSGFSGEMAGGATITDEIVPGQPTFVGMNQGTPDRVGVYDLAGAVPPCSAPSDVPWLSEDVTGGTTPAGGSSPVVVTFDSTGLAQGSYNANLCVESNDPDETMVVVPVSLDVVGSPDITVDPAFLEQTLFPDETATQQLEICNVGDAALNWNLVEAPALLGSLFTVGPQTNASGAKASAIDQPANVTKDPSVNFTPPIRTNAVLLDQTPNQVNGLFSDAGCENCPTGQQSIAENFALEDTGTIEQIVFWTGYFPADVPIDPDLIRVIFHQDGGGIPGAVVYDESNVAYDRVQTGVILFGVHEWMHTLTLATPVVLPAGNYWVEIFNNTGFGNDNFFWETGNPDTLGRGQAGSAFAFETPGGAWNFDGATDLAFQLLGTIGPVFDIPWLSETPTSGSVLPGECDIVNVTFDSTGFAVDDYTGALEISSNDPDEPTVTVPVTLHVVALEADLSLEKSGLPAVVKVGESIVYTLVVTNLGPGMADSPMLVDTLPAEVTFVSASVGCVEAAGVVTCTLPDLDMNETATVTITVTAADVGMALNSATVSSETVDPDLTNNTATATTTINPAFIYSFLPVVYKP